jgi:Flp pilus assembly protein TadG
VVVEAVLVIPVLMLVLLVVVQFALWAHAAQVVQLAASEGDRVARTADSSAGAGQCRALAVLAASGSGVSSAGATASVLPGDQIEITVTARAVAVLPWLDLPVSAKEVGPIQEFRTSG